MRKILLSIAASAVAATTLFTGTASAGSLGDYLGSGVRIRTVPVSGTILGLGYPGHRTCTDVIEGPESDGFFWAHHKNLHTGKIGWSRGDLISIGGGGCSF